MHGHVETSSYELLSASWVKKQFTIYNFRHSNAVSEGYAQFYSIVMRTI